MVFTGGGVGGGVLYQQRVLFSCLPRRSCRTFGFKVFQNKIAFTTASLMEVIDALRVAALPDEEYLVSSNFNRAQSQYNSMQGLLTVAILHN